MDALAQDKMFVLGQGRANGATNTDQVAGFAVANARVAYQVPTLGKRGEVFAAVENIFDKEYEMRAGYPMPGRSVQVGLHASF
jgi:iron complex outermembrane receptor protein